ncbi:podocan isoform 3-T3 [Spinachia spinachia]
MFVLGSSSGSKQPLLLNPFLFTLPRSPSFPSLNFSSPTLSVQHLEGISCGCVTPCLLWDSLHTDLTSDFSAFQQKLVGREKDKVLVQQESSAVDMALPKHSLLQALSVLLLALVLARCQAPLKTEEEDEEERIKEAATATEVTKSDPLECPPECSCTADGAVDCAGVDLTEFPAELHDNTRQLSLQNNKIAEITVQHISHLHQLETLNLQNNWLTTNGLEDEGFEMLEELAYLYLANNKLNSAPKVLPPSLVSADFAANQLTRIYPYTFGHKPNLRSVYLHNNKLSDAGLPDHTFNGSDNLEILTLSSNFLRAVPRNFPSSLYRLHLKSNKLEKIPEGAFDSLPNLRELYLQNNLLSNEGMDNETFSQLGSLECLDLSNNNLSVVPEGLPRNLVLLHLEKNSISSIPASSLASVRNLEYLLLHNNKLRSRSIHPTAFQTLDLSSNQLSHIPSDLPESLEYLYLQSNRISSVPASAFDSTPNIKGIFLRFNRLSGVPVDESSFAHLSNLQVLDIGTGNNNIHLNREEMEEEQEP